MEEKAEKHHPGRTVLLILLAILLLVLASPFIYDLIGGFKDYDDIPALIASDKGRALSVDEDGILSFSVDKAAAYSCAADKQIEEKLNEKLLALPFFSEKTVRFERFGYELNGEELGASVKLKLFGFIPVQLHADAGLKLSPDEAVIRLKELKYGKWITVPLEKYAASLDLPELTDGFNIDTTEFYGELCPLDVSAKGGEISFRCNIINETVSKVSGSGIVLAELMPVFSGEDPDAAHVLRGDAAYAYAKITDPASLSSFMTELLSFCYEEKAAELKPLLEDTPFIGLELDQYSGYVTALSEMLKEYEKEFTDIRDNYKKLNYHITADGLRDADDMKAEAPLPAAWGAKAVLQYDLEDKPIAKVIDGRRSGSGDWNVLPNPKLSELKRDPGVSLPTVPGVEVFDLGIAFKLTDDVPAIMFLTALDELGINVISEELYDEIVSYEGLPVYCTANIIAPAVYNFVTPEISQRDLMFCMP